MIPATDIDIDVADRLKVLEIFNHTTAAIDRNNRMVKHNTGVYFHTMPSNPLTGIATIDHKLAEEMGYFKLDILNVNIYQDVRDPDHLDELADREPMWELLEEDEFTDNLFHVKGHGEVMRRLKPHNLLQLAACLSIIRPAKRHLMNKSWKIIMDNVWTKPTGDDYYFKKGHSLGYAMVVAVHMNLICEQLIP